MSLRIALILIAILASTRSADAQATQPVSNEQRPLVQAAPATLQKLPQNGVGGDLLGIRQLFVGLLIVLSLIFAAKWFVPRVWPAVGVQRHSAVRVLGRTPISPKNQVVLVQVGQRVLVLGENANQLTTLSNIENPDEVALLIGKANARTDRTVEPSSQFSSALDQSNRAYAPSETTTAEDVSSPTASTGELSELISKVRGLARQIGRS